MKRAPSGDCAGHCLVIGQPHGTATVASRTDPLDRANLRLARAAASRSWLGRQPVAQRLERFNGGGFGCGPAAATRRPVADTLADKVSWLLCRPARSIGAAQSPSKARQLFTIDV